MGWRIGLKENAGGPAGVDDALMARRWEEIAATDSF